jgi:glycosyltransferase involved in cell wall biosynthesis
MQILLATPHYDEWRGNKITADRITSGIEKLGAKASIVSSTASPVELEDSTDLIHGFHAYKFALYYKKLDRSVPYIVTLTGTDINQDIHDPNRQQTIVNFLRKASFIHVFDSRTKQKVINYLPEAENKVIVIPQAVTPFPKVAGANFKKNPNSFVFFLPAGIREVKNIVGAIQMMTKLKQKFSKIELWLAGPIIETEQAEKVQSLVAHNDWITYLGQIPFQKMEAIYLQSDLILNTSYSEGQSSAIMEAMTTGKPVLASNISGNQSLIKHLETGCLFDNEDDFIDLASKLINDRKLRDHVSKTALEYITTFHRPDNEAKQIYHLYEQTIND